MSKPQFGSSTKQTFNNAYRDYLHKEEPGSLKTLIALIHAYAYDRLWYELEAPNTGFQTTGTAETADDWAQKVVINVMTALGKGTTPDNFPAWVSQIVKNQRHDAKRHLIKRRAEKVDLFVSGDPDEVPNPRATHRELNPAIYKHAMVPIVASLADNDRTKLSLYRSNPMIPTWTYIVYDDGTEDSTDAVISHLALNGLRSEEIAEWFIGRSKMSSFAVRQRLERLKQQAPDKDSREWRQPRTSQRKQPARWFRDPYSLDAKICSTIREPDAPTCYRCYAPSRIAA
jgi:hypothetical protein